MFIQSEKREMQKNWLSLTLQVWNFVYVYSNFEDRFLTILTDPKYTKYKV